VISTRKAEAQNPSVAEGHDSTPVVINRKAPLNGRYRKQARPEQTAISHTQGNDSLFFGNHDGIATHGDSHTRFTVKAPEWFFSDAHFRPVHQKPIARIRQTSI
jgi:hypothetical protein